MEDALNTFFFLIIKKEVKRMKKKFSKRDIKIKVLVSLVSLVFAEFLKKKCSIIGF